MHHTAVDNLAARIDVSLCDACGFLRMKDGDSGMDDKLPRDVVAALIAQVRQDIGRLTQEHREAFQTIDSRIDEVAKDVKAIQLVDANAAGQKQGVRMTMTWVVALSGLLGGFISWVISHLPWTTPKP